MTPDKAIEEIHAVRREISAAYGHDVQAFLEHYRALETQYKERLIGRREARAILPAKQVREEPNGNA
jgi:hypothetical protein